ncbi:hypothetical protein R3P38DRAFT_2820089 [Favolaschia claudopus]|uniref:F-box domain-containing protein n=1 Tax=Favolaschia claudopus TaxID=2862362 RepID=A0AAW0EGQ7_9AGAR
MSTTQSVLLRPRPYAQHAGSFFLVALLPPPKTSPSLPPELWAAIFNFVPALHLWSLLTVCKLFKDITLPVLYARVTTADINSLEKLVARLDFAEQRWDSIRRIPFSTPGRWIQMLDLSRIEYTGRARALHLDTLLVKLFPLVPFLAHLSMNPSFVLSRRALDSLGQRPGAVNIRALEGVSYNPIGNSMEESLLLQLQCFPNLEELELIGHGLDLTELDTIPELLTPEPFIPLILPSLRTLTIISVCSSPLLLAFLLSPLPSLRKLTITPYDDIPTSLSSRFIAAQGASLRSLLLFTPKTWPTRLHPSPDTLLSTSPSLRHLSLERPLPPRLVLPPGAPTHPLQILSVPRPDPEFWLVLERLLPRLPALRAVRARDVRWLRKGMGSGAQAAGVQGELREWRRRLLRRGIRVLDGDWNECE